MSFDGVDDYISTSNDVFTNSDIQQGTVSCNVNLNDTLADRHIFSLEGYVDIGLRKANSSVINCSWPLTSINAVSDGSSLCGGTGVYYPINLISNTNDWINISITWDGVDFIRMYIDGVLVSSSIPNSFPNVDATNRPITFGVHSSFNWSNYLGGNIDDIHLWDIPLSPQEIEQYISCPPVGNESGLIGLWIFEEGSGSTVYDQTANGNNGTINGATYSIDTPEQNCVGCIDPVSCNYIPYATVDNGSCDYTCCPGPGCCLDGQNWDWDLMGCVITNPTDSNLDGCTDLNDLMDILSAYGDCALSEVNYSLSFDGVDDWVDLGNSNDFDFSNSSLSIMCWVNINNNSYLDGIVSKCTSSNLGWWLSTVSNDPTWANPNTFTFSGSESSGNYFSTNSPIILNDWVFLSTIYINGEQKLYINGILVDQSSHQYNLYNSATNLLIGKKTGDTNYDGLMDNLEIWNSALTQEQIQSYMSTPPTGNEEGLVGYWDFNEGTGSTLTDKTSNGNDGVINGATWSTDVPTAP